jgi:hypothetical protein
VRRVMFTVVATVLMAGAVPAAALAQHHHKHHARHHARFRHFGNDSTPPTSMNASDNAGTVQSFQNGVLTIALNDGSTVKGAVTNDTELECMAPEQSSTTHEDGDGGGGDQSSGDNEGTGGNDQGDNDQNEAQGEDQNEDQNEGEANNNCSTSNLTSGAVVHEASLRIGGSGAVWQKVELVS